MACDMVLALPSATGSGQTLFGGNVHRPPGEAQKVRLCPGRTFALGESLATQFLQLPQVRQSYTVLAIQPASSLGYALGINECRVAVGCSDWQSRFKRDCPGLLGPELVRLTLERSHGARHALEVLTDLIARHGQGGFPGSPEGDSGDHVFLVADPTEAFAVEAAGSTWAAQQIHHVRAVSDVGTIRQDWSHIAPGLADRAISAGLWSNDGSKLDFTGALNEDPAGKASAMRRWGRATLLMEQQAGHLDTSCLLRILADHYHGTHYEVDPLRGPAPVTPLCQHGSAEKGSATAASAVAQLPGDSVSTPVLWLALGPPCIGVHFPLLLEGELPGAFSGEGAELWARNQELTRHMGTNPRRWRRVRESLGRLQTLFEQDIEELLAEVPLLKQRGDPGEMRRLATSLMQRHVERWEETTQAILEDKGGPLALVSAVFSSKVEF
jgi:secernin